MSNLKSINDTIVGKINTRGWLQLLLKELNFRTGSWLIADVIDPVDQNRSLSDPILNEIMDKYDKYLHVIPDRIKVFMEQKRQMIKNVKSVSERVNTILKQFDINFTLSFDNTTFFSIDCWSAAAAPFYMGFAPQHCGFDNYLIWQTYDNNDNHNTDVAQLYGIKYEKAEAIGL